MDVYDEVDRRENDAGERGARGATGPPRAGVGVGVTAWGGAVSGATAEPSAFPPPRSGSVRRDRRPLLPHSSGREGFLRARGRRWVPGLGCCWRWVPGHPGDGGSAWRDTRTLGGGGVGATPLPRRGGHQQARQTLSPLTGGGGGAELMPQRVRSWGSLLGGTGGTPAPRGGRGKPFPSARSGSTPSPGKLAPRPRLRPAGSAAGPRPCRPLAPGGVGVSGPRSPPWGCDTGCLPVVWLTTQNHSTLVTERSAVPFLPVNPEYSATRNQVNPSPRPRYPPLHLAPRPLLLPPLPPSPGPAEAGQVQRQGVCHLAHRHPRGSQAPAAREESAEPHR